MAKTKHDEALKGICFIIHRDEIDDFLDKHFQPELCKIIRLIMKKCFSWQADMVMIFLNNDRGNYTCCCFLPIYITKEGLLLHEKKAEDINGCIKLPPVYVRTIHNLPEGVIFSLNEKAAANGYWHKEYSFCILNEDGDRKMLKMNTTPFSDLRIKKETLDFEMEQISLYTSLMEKYPNEERYVKIIKDSVLMLEDHRRQYDFEIGFTKVQYKAHDYAFRMPKVINGIFNAIQLESFIQFITSFFRDNHPFFQHDFGLKLTPSLSSTILFVDIVPKEIKPENIEGWEKSKTHLKKIVQAIPSLTKQGDTEKRVDDFCEKAELNPPQANKILKTVQKIFPASVDSENTIQIFTREQADPAAEFDQNGFEYFLKAKKDLSDSLKPTKEEVINGFLGLMVGWEESKPTFTIKTDDKKKITIRYDIGRVDEVKARFKTYVTLQRIKDGNGWQLLDWK